ncbi:MAG: hypothetical protein CVU84_12730 [Firmicutes bacterium HGW-Firmicutes-1]|nr:MAG: hypothetical protein CVU84_12730 [Firmicutes bacterium HGW-Firmicutes-1]
MNEHNSNMDFTEVIKMAQTLSQNQEKITPPEVPPIDKIVNNQDLRIMKATLPYFDYPYQKNFAMLIKLLEFRKTMDVFRPSSELHTTFQQKKELNTLGFLSDIRNCCDEPQQKKLNMIISLLNMQTTMENYKNNPKLLQSHGQEPDNIQKEATHDNDGYNQFMKMVNKIIDEKEGD